VKDLAGNVAVITGGGSGIGRGLARAFAEAGMRVAVADIEADSAAAVAKEVDGLPFAVDVSSLESVQRLAEDVYAAMGRVDVLCNNAGVGLAGPTEALTAADWRWVFSVNVDGVVHGLLAFLPRIRAQGTPAHIVNTGSLAGLLGLPGAAPYCASKAAVVVISESLRAELGNEGIGVTVICPASVRTRIGEAARNRPVHLAPSGSRAPRTPPEDAVDPDALGRRVRQAVLDDELYVIPLTESDALVVELIGKRFETIVAVLDRA
jgi:NAD(P)-dependent dehydrogenase (short-subunit alcohol dehydrogenase family)